MEAFEKYGIEQITSAAVSEIFSDGVSYKNAADKSDETIYEARGFDTVVLSMGFSSVIHTAMVRMLYMTSLMN